MGTPEQRQPCKTPPSPVLNPPSWLSPRCHNGSTLYDSFELQAVTKQLNRAIQGTKGPLSPYACYLNSPFYTRCLDRIYKRSAKAQKRILSSGSEVAASDTKASQSGTKGTRGFVLRLWQKVKHRFARRQS